MVQHKRRLHRSIDDRFLFGVAGGLADFFDIDPVLVRVGWAVLTVATLGIAALAYLVLVIVTPNGSQTASGAIGTADDLSNEGSDRVVEANLDEGMSKRHLARNLFGVGMIILGMIVLLGNLGVFDSVRWEIVWPVVIVVLGVTILLPSIRR